MLLGRWWMCLGLAMGLVGCADDSGNEPAATESGAEEDTSGEETAGEETSGEEPFVPPVEPGKLIEIEPGGETTCSRGTPFRFFVNGGSSNRVILDFGGGGACWDSVTCSVAGAIFQEEAPSLATVQLAVDGGLLGGIYDRTDENNPFLDWTLVHVPYCTGDVHWGDATHEYGEDLTIHHRGAVNAKAVLEWVYANFPHPEQVFVTGCSAGAYGAIMHSAYIAEHYGEEVSVTALGDSGIGVITDTFFADSFPNWNAEAQLPDWIDAFQGIDINEMDITDVYSGIANHYPTQRFAHYTTAFDSNQEFYYTAMGGDVEEWNTTATQYLSQIREEASNFRYFLAPGEIHCAVIYDIFYDTAVGDVTLNSWVHDLVFGDSLPDDAVCEGEACAQDVLCDICATSESPGMWCGHCGN